MEEEKHNVEIIEVEIDEEGKAINEVLKDTKEQILREGAVDLYKAEAFDTIEDAKKAEKKSPKKDVQLKIKKTKLLDRLPGIDKNDIWGDEFIYQCVLKDKHFISKQQRYWLLNNFEISQKHHEVDWWYLLTAQDFFSLSAAKMQHPVIWALKELNILELVGKEYCQESPEIKEVIDKIKTRDDIQLALNFKDKLHTIKPDGKSDIKIIGDLLDKIGFKNEATTRKNVKITRLINKDSKITEQDDITRLVHHKAIPIDYEVSVNDKELSAREAILEAIERRQKAWIESDKSKVDWEIQTLPSVEEK